MTRKFVILLAALSLLTTLPACTSGDSKGEEEVIAEDGTSEELAGLSEDGGSSGNLDESLDGEQTADTTTSPDALTTDTAATATEDQLTIDSFGEGSTDTAANSTDGLSEPVPEPAAPEAEPAAPTTNDVAANDLSAAPSTGAQEITPPTTTTPDPVPEQTMSTASTDLDQPKPASKSLQKVAEAPWKVGSKWVNAIYFVRPGDSLESISQTIYGDDRTKELKKINPTYKSRDVKPGDKVYYSSAIRPDDSEKVVTFFEEKNIPSKTYTAKPGDNIRKISKELLGYPEAWKEVWASNTVESKQEIPEGTELRYWDSNAVASAGGSSHSNDMANNNQMPSTPPPMEPPPMEPTGNMPPPPPDMGGNNMAGNDLPPPPSELPPPPDMGGNNMAGNDLPPPPPPPPMEVPPPPPPPMETAPPPAVAHSDEAGGTGMAEEDQTLAMGAVAAAVLGAVALVIVRRKRRQKEMDQALGETHVG